MDKGDAMLESIRQADVGDNVIVHNEDGSVFCILNVLTKEHPESGLLEAPAKLPGCGICGGKTVFIRGKYPGDNKRKVCATCTTERLEHCSICLNYKHAIEDSFKKPTQQPSCQHRSVTEYDGAFHCNDCLSKWGALPGNPEMPKECKPKPQPERAYSICSSHQWPDVDPECPRCKIKIKIGGAILPTAPTEKNEGEAEDDELQDLQDQVAQLFHDVEGVFAATPKDALEAIKEMFEDKKQAIEKLTASNERMERLLRLILPMAKGYAAKNNVGSNMDYISEVEQALSDNEKEKP